MGLSACNASDATSSRDGKGDKGNRVVSVVVSRAAQKTVPVQVRTTGTVKAYSTVSIKSQVEGRLTGVYFQEGQEVKKGKLLFTIDSRALEANLRQAQAMRAKDLAQIQQAKANVGKAIAQVNQAKANLAKAIAESKYANAQAQRYLSLEKEGAISREQAEQFQTNAISQQATVTAAQNAVADAIAAVAAAKADVTNAQAVVEADEAAIANAQIELSYTSIKSPIDGRTGNLQINQGNLVKANADDPIIVISQIRPIYVSFSLPQRLLPDLKKYSAENKLIVEAQPPKTPGRPVRGQLTFVDSGVNPQTGTIELKGTFPNQEGSLVPGQFVNVVLRLTQQPNMITVPSVAVQTGQKGQYVYVVTADQTAEVRPVVVGQTFNNQTVIQRGLQAGEQVVTDGQFNLVPHAKVNIKPGLSR
uniref:Efflux transporter, RND family, MFP subunit n=2 Tax=Gloeothece TaxID=28070 RepID=E0UG58_GLOV7|nr:efflux transporter, RND family, MFP subunit [Gloeothece verrucosa PCC 7822]